METAVLPNAIVPTRGTVNVTLDPTSRTVVATVTGEMSMEEDTVVVVVVVVVVTRATVARTVVVEEDVVTFEVAATEDEVAGTIGILRLVEEVDPLVVAEVDIAAAEEEGVDIVVEGEGAIDECSLD
jgi:hypothetical protein